MNKLGPTATRPRSLSTTRKPRCDSPLRMLPWERQKQIIASLQTKSQKDVLADLLHTDRINIKAAALSRFSKWHHARAEAFGELVHDWLQKLENLDTALKNPLPGADMNAMIHLGLRLGCARALEDMDMSELVRLKRVQQRDKMAELHERRVAIVERKEEAGFIKAEHQTKLDTVRARELCSQLPPWCEAEAKKNEPVQVTEEMIEDNLRKSFDLRRRPQPAPTPAPTPAPKTPHSAFPTQHSTTAAQPSPVAALGTAPHSQPPQPVPVPVPEPPVATKGQGPLNPAGASVPDTQHETRNSSLLPPEPPYWHPPANQAPVNLPEERMCIAELLNVPLPGDKYLRMGHAGLDLASKTKAFYPRLLCKVEFLTPEYVREVMADIRRGAL
jgi:hypothetical protein